MSVCTFIAADSPLKQVAPPQEYPLEINIDDGTVYDGGADDNYFLFDFSDSDSCTNKKYAVYLEWNPTRGRAERLAEYIRAALNDSETVELWHIWMGSCEKPLIRSRTVPIHALTPEDIRALMDSCVTEEFYDTPIQYRIVITAE